VLATHRAWTFIDLNDEHSSRLLPLFLKRSGHRRLHVGLQTLSDHTDFATVAQVADRIQCLSIPRLQKQLRGIKSPLLGCLRINDETTVEPLLQLSITQFPKLHHLEYTYYPTRADLTSGGAVLGFPALQSLSLVGYGFVPLSDILPKCSASLRSLEMLINDSTYFLQQHIINLPRLETLVFYNRSLGTIRNPPQFVTPALKAVRIGSSDSSRKFPLQMDLGMLKHVQTEYEQIPPLSALRGIKVLQVHLSPRLLTKLIKTLALDSSTCPCLEIVEYDLKKAPNSDHLLFYKTLLEIKDNCGRNLQFVEAGPLSLPLPGYIEETVRHAVCLAASN
jgi:hypothetical protein